MFANSHPLYRRPHRASSFQGDTHSNTIPGEGRPPGHLCLSLVLLSQISPNSALQAV